MPLFGVQFAPQSTAFQQGVGQGAQMAAKAEELQESRRQFDAGQPLRDAKARLAEQTADYYGDLTQARLDQMGAQTESIISQTQQSEGQAALSIAQGLLGLQFDRDTYQSRVEALIADTAARKANAQNSVTQSEVAAIGLERMSSALGKMGWAAQQTALIAGSNLQRRQAEDQLEMLPELMEVEEAELALRAEKLALEALTIESQEEFNAWLGGPGADVIMASLGDEMGDALRGILEETDDPAVAGLMIREALGNQILLRQARRVGSYDEAIAAFNALEDDSLFDAESDILDSDRVKLEQQQQEQDFGGAVITLSRIKMRASRRIEKRRRHNTASQWVAGILGATATKGESKDSVFGTIDSGDTEPAYLQDLRSWQRRDPQSLSMYETRAWMRSMIEEHGSAEQKRMAEFVMGGGEQPAAPAAGGQSGATRTQGGGLGGVGTGSSMGYGAMTPEQLQAAMDALGD